MALTTGPLMSLDASGSVGGALVFSKWKGRNYVRRLVKPANPRSGGQVGMRAMMKFLSQRWDALSAADKATWEARADATIISNFNAYTKLNLQRWRSFDAPSQTDPPATTGVVDVLTGEAATGGLRQILLEATIASAEGDNWGICIFRSTSSSFTTLWSNCIAVVYGYSGGSLEYIDTPLDPGTYYYNFRPFRDDGILGAEETEVNAAAT